MDPLTAWALAIRAGFEMVTEIVKGQPIDVKIKAWERWDRQMDTLERIFNFNMPKPVADPKPKEH